MPVAAKAVRVRGKGRLIRVAWQDGRVRVQAWAQIRLPAAVVGVGGWVQGVDVDWLAAVRIHAQHELRPVLKRKEHDCNSTADR